MNTPLFEQLAEEQLITDEALERVKKHERDRLVSVHWDLRTLLYFGVLLMSTGIGILLYKHIDTIGHAALVTITGVLAAVCFVYCLKKANPFSWTETPSPNVWFDYILLLGCLLMLTFVGYLQYQYHVFGMQWGMATFIPMLALFFLAYYFDHKGVLSMAIVNLGAWLGIAVSPMQLVRAMHFTGDNLIINGVLLGVLLHLLSGLSMQKMWKPHFAPVYKNFGVHVLFISLIAAMIHFSDTYLLWFIPFGAVLAYHARIAFMQRSLYYLVVATLYGYIGCSIVAVRLLSKLDNHGESVIYSILLYLIVSGVALVFLLIHLNKLLKKHDRL